MKKRILSLLLALCMIAALLPVTALAEDAVDLPSVKVTFYGIGSAGEVTLNAGDVKYQKTTASGDYSYPVGCEADDEWNIKYEYLTTGEFVATLRDAYLKVNLGEQGLYFEAGTVPVKLVLEGSNHFDFNKSPNHPPLRFNTTAGSTITGSGTLKIENESTRVGMITAVSGNLTFDHANVHLHTPALVSNNTYGISASDSDIIVKGGCLRITGAYRSNHNYAYEGAIRAKNLTLENGALVQIYGSPANGTTYKALMALSGALTIKDSTIEIARTYSYWYMFNIDTPPQIVADFAGDYYVTTGTSAGSYNNDTDTYTAPTTGTTMTKNMDMSTLSITNSLLYFRVSDKPTTTVTYKGADDKSASVKMNAGDTPKYFTTGAYNEANSNYSYMKETTEAENWNVKVEYPANSDLTVTLKNADIHHAGDVLSFSGGRGKIVLIGDNYLTSTTGDLVVFGSAAGGSIVGPGKLTVESDPYSTFANENGLVVSYGNLVLDNADLHMKTINGGNRSHIFLVTGGDLTVKGGNLLVDAPSSGDHGLGMNNAFRVLKSGEVGGNLTIQDSAIVKVRGGVYNETNVNTGAVCIHGVFTIINSDVEIANITNSYAKVFTSSETTGAVAPTLSFTGDYNVITSANKGSYTIGTYSNIFTAPTATPQLNATGFAVSGLNYFRVSPVHDHVEGEPVYENTSEGICSTTKVEIISCTLCGDVLSRKNVTVSNENVHTPGEAVENVALRETVKLDSVNDVYPTGYYVMETHCTVCGELVKTEKVAFEAGLFYTITSGSCGGISETATEKPQIVLNPGETKYYTTVQTTNTTYPDSWYRANGTADNWNIKLEYPVGGNPIMTLKGATIKNDSGIFYGIGKYVCKAPLTIVVEEDSMIASKVDGLSTGQYPTYNNALTLRTSAGVTITGPGKLTISSDSHSEAKAAILCYSNLIFDNATVEMLTVPNAWPSSNGIWCKGGDLFINSSNLTVLGPDTLEDSSATAFLSVLRATTVDNEGGNVTIQGGSKVTALVSTVTLNAVQTDGTFTIKDSEVEFAAAGSTYTSLFNATSKPVLDFTKKYTVVASTNLPSYNAETGVLTPPTTGIVDFASAAGTGLYYFKVGFAPVAFAGTQVVMESSLDLNFAIRKDVSDTTGYVEFVREYADGSTKTTKVSLADCLVEGNDTVYVMTYHDIAAKEMGDKVHVTVRTAGGAALTETYTDSIETYALRMLRKDLYADDTVAYNLILKNLLVDMLYYGAAAQVNFSYDVEDPVTAELTEAEKDYHTSAMKECTTEQTVSDPALYQGTQFVLESKLSMNMAVSTDAVSAKVSYTDHMGNEITDKDAILNEELTAEANGSANVFVFNDMVAADGECVITWNFYNENDELILTVTDGLAIYVTRMKDSYPWLETIAIYSNSAYAFLHQQSV